MSAQEHERLSNDSHLRAVRLRAQDEEQVPRKARPLGHETLQRKNRQNISALQALHLPLAGLHLHREG